MIFVKILAGITAVILLVVAPMVAGEIGWRRQMRKYWE
jgi:hypothetical protein